MLDNEYRPGSYNVICQRCGFKYKIEQVRKEWTGLLVCHGPRTNDCWEQRNPADLSRPTRPVRRLAWTRPEQPDQFITYDPVFVTISGVSGTVAVGTPATSVSVAASGNTGIGELGAFNMCAFSATPATGVASVPYIAVVDSYLYIVSSSGDTITIYDVTYPTSPVLKSTTSVGAGKGPTRCEVIGNYLYTIYKTTDTFAIWDVTDKVNPALAGSCAITSLTSGNTGFLTVSGNTAFVGNTIAGNGSPAYSVRKIDVTTKTAPVETGGAWWVSGGANSSTCNGLLYTGSRLFCSGFRYASAVDGQTAIFEINPSTMATISSTTFGALQGGVHCGELAINTAGTYVFTEADGNLYSMNVTTNAVSTLSAIWASSSGVASPMAYRSSDAMLFVGKYNGGNLAVYKFDASNPTSVSSSGTISSNTEGVSDIAIVDDECLTLVFVTWTGGASVYLKGNP